MKSTFASTDNVMVSLTGHGTFATTVAEVALNDKATKRNLAHRIAEAYGGNCGPASKPTYWLTTYPKSVLSIVLGGLIAPTK
jgi:hypothetical protein